MEIHEQQGRAEESSCGAKCEGLDLKLIQLLDSTDEYLNLYNSLSDAMRQGWLQIAAARYSMGSSRISETLFSLKPQSSRTSISLDYTGSIGGTDEDPLTEEADGNISKMREGYPTSFTLHKWESKKDVERDVDTGFDEKQSASDLRHRPLLISSDKTKREALTDREFSESNSSPAVSQAQKLKSEALSLFGTLVSPQLRFAQGSFETALEILVQLAKARTTMLSICDQLSKEKEVVLCGKIET